VCLEQDEQAFEDTFGVCLGISNLRVSVEEELANAIQLQWIDHKNDAIDVGNVAGLSFERRAGLHILARRVEDADIHFHTTICGQAQREWYLHTRIKQARLRHLQNGLALEEWAIEIILPAYLRLVTQHTQRQVKVISDLIAECGDDRGDIMTFAGCAPTNDGDTA